MVISYISGKIRCRLALVLHRMPSGASTVLYSNGVSMGGSGELTLRLGGSTMGLGEALACCWKGQVLLRSQVRVLKTGGHILCPAHKSARVVQSPRCKVFRLKGAIWKLNGPSR